MVYTLHMERTDGTLDDAFHTVSNKRKAIRAARNIASEPIFDTMRIIVQDANEMTVMAFKVPTKKEDSVAGMGEKELKEAIMALAEESRLDEKTIRRVLEEVENHFTGVFDDDDDMADA